MAVDTQEIREVLPEFSLQIQGDDTHPIISNFDDLEDWTAKAVKYAKGQIVSADAKDLKPIRAQLNKLYDKLEEARKSLKRRIEAPYKEWETRYKEAIGSLTSAIDEIGGIIKSQENKERDERLAEIEQIIKREVGGMDPSYYPITQKVEVRSWFFDKKWENKSTSRSEIEKGIRTNAQLLLTGLAAAETMAKPDIAKNVFLSTGSLIEAKVAVEKALELEALAKKTELPAEKAPTEDAALRPEGAPSFHTLTVKVPNTLDDEEKRHIRIHRTIAGPKGNIRILLEVAASLGLELTKITREDK